MKGHSYSSQGIVLSKKDLGEADKLITIYSKDFGKLSLIAKGIKRPTSRKRGHLEIFANINFNAIKGSNLDILTEVDTINSFESFKKNLKKVSLAYYFLEVVNKITHENEPNEELFSLLLRYLRDLRLQKELKKYRQSFIQNLLTSLGFWPEDSKILNHDEFLEEVLERKINSFRVGKILTNV